MSNRIELMQSALTTALSPSTLDIEDESRHHVGHPGAASGAGHFHVSIASPAFEGKSRVASHQLIYQALADLMDTEIHALRITLVKA